MTNTQYFLKNTVIIRAAVIAAMICVSYPAHALTLDAIEKKVVSAGGYDALLSQTQERGKVRILARVNVRCESEKTLSKTAARAQRTSIRTTQSKVISELAERGIKPDNTHRYTYVPYLAMTVDHATLDTLLASNNVIHVEEDVPVPPTATVGWDISKIGADTLHTAGVTGTGIAVAVLDTGVDKNHPYLSGAVVSEACYSSNGSDTNGSWSSLCPGSATDSTATDSALPYGSGVCPTGECDHGTHVSGTVAGRSGVTGSPGAGVAPNGSIIAIQVFSRFDSDTYCGAGYSPCALSWSSDQLKGLERVYALKDSYVIASANLSLGGGRYYNTTACDEANSSTKAAIDNLRGAGIATVIAAGNNGYCGSMGAPGCVSTAVSVGATDSSDAVASYSNSASFLSLLAPGSNITSSIPGNTYAAWNGTSMATPHVAGAWALVKSKDTSATVDDILAAFSFTGAIVTDTKCASVAKKRINVSDAYNVLGQAHTLAVVNSPTGAGTVTSSPSGITCGSTCSAAFSTTVTLRATAVSGYIFTGWSGGCTGTGATCAVAMDADKTVTASYIAGKVLAVSKSGTGTGTVRSDSGGINCGPSCNATYTTGATVTLRPTAATASSFAYWTGACSGASPACTVTMDATTNVTAVFYLTKTKRFKLTAVKNKVSSGDGDITSSDGLIVCGSGANCGNSYYPGAPVTLKATAMVSSVFTGWSGACTGTEATCSLAMDAAKTATASFMGPQKLTITKRKVNSGDGTVMSNPSGINCGDRCKYSFTVNTVVTLTATATGGSVFSGWSGSCTGTEAACTVTMDAAKTATASFMGPYTLKVVKVSKRGGEGTVTSNPSGIDCGNACRSPLPYNTVVTLTATPEGSSGFTGWSGAGCSGVAECAVTMNAAKTVSATFTGP
jgi:uncharacterized repeat protein (TIGR02543 family)